MKNPRARRTARRAAWLFVGIVCLPVLLPAAAFVWLSSDKSLADTLAEVWKLFFAIPEGRP